MTLVEPDAPGEPLPVLWICGAPGTGKSVTAWQLFESHRDEQVAYVDVDQIKMLAPEPGDPFDLAVANLAGLVEVHRRLGTRALIVSGVILPRELPVLEAGVAGRAAVTWVLTEVDEDTLRHRIRARGWPEQLVEMVVDEARAWRNEPVAVRIDTAATTPAAAAGVASTVLRLRPSPAALVHTDPEPDEGDDLVVVYGPRAIGKSTISWGLFTDCAGRGEPTGYLDADQLGFVHADATLRDRLVRLAVSALARNFAAAGAQRTVVNGNLSTGLVASFHGSRASLLHLDAPREVLVERIAGRHGGDDARLAGDDLVRATSQTRAAVLERALQQRDEYAGTTPLAHRVDVSDAHVDGHVRTLRDLLAMP